MNAEDEQRLIGRSPNDPPAFAALYDRYYPIIFGYVFRRVADYDLSRDIVAETFLRAWLHIGGYRWRGVPFSAWLYRIATNELNQYFRRQRYQPVSLTQLYDYNSFDPPDPASLDAEKAAAERQLGLNAEFVAVQRQLCLLPLPYQEVLALRYFEQKSVREISEITKRREGTVKSLLSRGIEKLRRLLAPAGPASATHPFFDSSHEPNPV